MLFLAMGPTNECFYLLSYFVQVRAAGHDSRAVRVDRHAELFPRLGLGRDCPPGDPILLPRLQSRRGAGPEHGQHPAGSIQIPPLCFDERMIRCFPLFPNFFLPSFQVFHTFKIQTVDSHQRYVCADFFVVLHEI